jgi:hypothetical protein
MTDPRVAEFEVRHHCRLLGRLGPGVGQDGFVQRSDRLTAVKFFDRADRFAREREVYVLLRDKGIHDVAGHRVLRLINVAEDLLAIEMSIVERPFVLDFAGAKRPEKVPDFEQHVIDEHLQHLQDLFGDRLGRCRPCSRDVQAADGVRAPRYSSGQHRRLPTAPERVAQRKWLACHRDTAAANLPNQPNSSPRSAGLGSCAGRLSNRFIRLQVAIA